MNKETIIANARAEGLSVHQYLHRHYQRTKKRLAEASRQVEEETPQTVANDWRHPNPPIPVEAIPAPSPEPSTKMGRLAKEICERHGITGHELRGTLRRRHLTAARHEFCWRAVNELGFQMTQVGKYLHKDHTTVLHGVRKYKERVIDAQI